MFPSEATSAILESLYYLVTVLGVPAAILIFWNQKRWERRERELAAHASAQETYIAYLTLCLDHPDANGFEYVETDPDVSELGLSIKQITLFTILVSMLESAYLRYRYQPSNVQDSQWLGWLEYIQWWFRRDDFRRAWTNLSPQFHTEFVNLGNQLAAGVQPSDLVRPTRSRIKWLSWRSGSTHPGRGPL